MSSNAEVLHALIDTVDRELKTAVGNGTIEQEFRRQRNNIVSKLLLNFRSKLTAALGQDNAHHTGQPGRPRNS